MTIFTSISLIFFYSFLNRWVGGVFLGLACKKLIFTWVVIVFFLVLC